MMVVDEADMTFDLGFLETVDEIASRMPENLQMSVFSATIPDKIKPFLKKYLGNPKVIQIENTQLVSPTIKKPITGDKGTRSNGRSSSVTCNGSPLPRAYFRKYEAKSGRSDKRPSQP